MDFLNRINELQNITVYYYTSEKKKKKKKNARSSLTNLKWCQRNVGERAVVGWG